MYIFIYYLLLFVISSITGIEEKTGKLFSKIFKKNIFLRLVLIFLEKKN